MKAEARILFSKTRNAFVVLALFGMAAIQILAGNFYAGTSPANVPWPGGIVPYEFTNTLTAAQQATYLAGIREWELAANVKFVPHTNQARWILFDYNTNGFDNVSAGYNPQIVSVSSLSRAQVCHEMGHSFGFTHENIRPDATNFVVVLTNNIANEPANIVWFTVDPTSITNGSYDFESVMHLGWDFDSIQPGTLATQQSKPPNFPRYQFRMGNLTLSPGDRAALKFLYGPPATPLTNIVTTTADAGPGSLRAAMYYATDHPGAIVTFNIPVTDPGCSNGIFTIHLTGQLPTLVSNTMTIDGSTQPGFADRPLIVLDASQIIPETFTSDTLLVYSAGNQVKNISLQGFNWNAITLIYADATNNTISGCWIGLDSTGTNSAPNSFQGILITDGAGWNTIGGTNALARNVISGNKQYGLYLANTTGNVILGNFIGTDATGSTALANGSGGAILSNNCRSNLIGSANSLARNIISGNTNAGIWIVGAQGNFVQGNFVGLDAAGTAALPNTFAGMYLLAGAQSNFVSGNVFSGQPSEGLRIADPGTSFNVVQGNYFGTDAAATNSIPNAFAGATIFNGATSNTLGGSSVSARNVISGNGSYGVVIGDPGTSGNLLAGNFIGTDVTGTNALGNSFANVAVWNGATGNSIGGIDAGMANVIAFGYLGVVLYDSGTTNNSFRGNSIFANTGLGIDLNGDGLTLNDPGDADNGPNHLQNFPVITNVFASGASTIVSGTLNSTPNRNFWIDAYVNKFADPSGYGQGGVYVGSTTATTDGSGNCIFLLNAGGNFAGQIFSATATDQTTGGTSEFSADVVATNGPVPPSFLSPVMLTSTGFIAEVSLTIGQNYRVQATTNLSGNPIPWTDMTNFTASATNFVFLDRSARDFANRFYRVISP